MAQSLLSSQLQYTPTFNFKSSIMNVIDKITNTNEREILMTILFKNRSKNVRYLPIDYNWIFNHKYDCVLKATMHLSSITFELSSINFENNMSKYIVNYVLSTYNMLKDGLKTLCCEKSPKANPYTNINIDSLVEISNQILSDFAKNT